MFPISTGQVAQLLGTTEPKLSEEVRRGRVVPPPPVVAGRRLWRAEHVRQVAERLGLLTPEVDQRLGGAGIDAVVRP